MIKRWLKRLVAILVVLALGGALVYAFLPQPVVADFGQVQRGRLEVAVEEDGKTRIRDRYIVSSPLVGKLRRVKWRAGDQIASGELVAVVEPTDPTLLDARTIAQSEARVHAAEASLEEAAAGLDRVRSMLNFAEGELARAQKLSRHDATSRQELEEKEMLRRMRAEELRQMQHAQEVAQFELQVAQAAMLRTRPNEQGTVDPSHFEIRTPPLSTGSRSLYILRVLQESETVVAAGTPLLELGDPANLEIEIDVLSGDAVKIRPGARVVLEQWGGDFPLEARVRLVEPSGFLKISALGVEEQRVNVIADFSHPDQLPDTLRDAFRVEARIIVWENTDCLKVPNSALFRHQENWAVFRVLHGRAARTPVQVGQRNGLEAEVTGGLAEGDTVVVHPSDKVLDGVRIESR